MGKSLIQTVNQSTQSVENNSIISLGSVLRRYGCGCKMSGNAIEVIGQGYYKIDVCVTLVPTTTNDVTVALFENGVQIPGAIATGAVATVGNSLTLPIITTIRKPCCYNNASSITCVLVNEASTVSNISVRVTND